MDENGMKFDEGEVDELTRALFHDATVVTSTSNSNGAAGGITFDALKAQLTKHDGLLQNLSISIDRWLVPPKPKKPATIMESVMAKVQKKKNQFPCQIDINPKKFSFSGSPPIVCALHAQQPCIHLIHHPVHSGQFGSLCSPFLRVLELQKLRLFA